jgi:hypothetical protein
MNSKTFLSGISRFLVRSLLWISILVFVLAIAGMIYQTAATEADQRKYPAPGEPGKCRWTHDAHLLRG